MSSYFDSSHRDTLIVQEKFENNVWKFQSRVYNEYDLYGHVIRRQTDYWNCFWEPHQKDSMNYNSSGHLLFTETDYWDDFNYQWQPSSRTSHYPDAANHDTLDVSEQYRGSGWTYTFRNLSTLTYFPDHYCRDNLEEEFNFTHWTTLNECITCYDTSGRILDGNCGSSSESYQYNLSGNEIVHSYHWYNNGGTLISGVDSTFYFGIGEYHISFSGNFKICHNDSMFMGFWGSGFTDHLKYQWSPASGLSNDTILDPLVSPDTSTLYSLQVTENAIPAGTYQVSVEVKPLPVAGILILSVDTISSCSSAILISDTLNQNNFCYWYLNGIAQQTSWGSSCTLPIDENGNYVLIAGNSLGCSASDTLNVAFLTDPAPSVTISKECNSLIASSPSATSYQWYRYSSPMAGEVNDTLKLTSGNNSYRVLITDVNGCQNFSNYIELAPMTATIYGYPQCHDSCSGWMSLGVSYATEPLSYSWSNGDTTYRAINLCPSIIYSVTITDARGCSITESDSLMNPAPLVSHLISGFVSDPDSCDAFAAVYPSGGLGHYYYEWNDGSHQPYNHLCYGWNSITVCLNLNCMITDSIFTGIDSANHVCDLTLNPTSPVCGWNCQGTINTTMQGIPPIHYLWSNGNTSSSASNLCNGTYTVYAIDSAGCLDSASATIDAPPPLYVLATIVAYDPNEPCSTLVQAHISGGVTPYTTVSWCNGDTGIQTYACPGPCIINFSDSAGCNFNDTLYIPQPPSHTCSATTTSVASNFNQCNGSAAIVPTGTAPFTYLWSSADTSSAINSLCPGTYYFSVSDAYGCTINDSAVVGQLAPVCDVAINEASGIVCFGDCNGELEALPSGISPFHFIWSTGDTSATADSACAGNYTVIMTDSVGCIDTASYQLLQPNQIAVTHNTIYGCSDCMTDLVVQGGVFPYAYLWCNMTTASSLIYCGPGVCTVTVTDQNGCVALYNVTLIPPPALTLTYSSTGTTCTGCTDGSISSVAGGGNPPYIYSVFPPNIINTTGDFDSLAAGTYIVCATDNDSCTVCDSIFVPDDPSGILSTGSQNAISVFPNPASKQFTVISSTSDLACISIQNALGSEVYSSTVVNRKKVISCIDFTEGMYFLKISINGKTITRKLIITK